MSRATRWGQLMGYDRVATCPIRKNWFVNSKGCHHAFYRSIRHDQPQVYFKTVERCLLPHGKGTIAGIVIETINRNQYLVSGTKYMNRVRG